MNAIKRILVLVLVLSFILVSLPVVSQAAKKVYKFNWQTYAMPNSDMFKTATDTFKNLPKPPTGGWS